MNKDECNRNAAVTRDVNGTLFSRVPKKFPVPGKKISRSGGFPEIAIIEFRSVFVRALLV